MTRQRRGRRRLVDRRLGAAIVVLTVLLAACAQPAPTSTPAATPTQAPSPTATAAPTPSPTPTPSTPTPTPSTVPAATPAASCGPSCERGPATFVTHGQPVRRADVRRWLQRRRVHLDRRHPHRQGRGRDVLPERAVRPREAGLLALGRRERLPGRQPRDDAPRRDDPLDLPARPRPRVRAEDPRREPRRPLDRRLPAALRQL